MDSLPKLFGCHPLTIAAIALINPQESAGFVLEKYYICIVGFLLMTMRPSEMPDVPKPYRRDPVEHFMDFLSRNGIVVGLMSFYLAACVLGFGYYSVIFVIWAILVSYWFEDGQSGLAKFWLIVGLVAFAFTAGHLWHRDSHYEGTITSIDRGRAGEKIELEGGFFKHKMTIYLPYRTGIAGDYKIGDPITAVGPEITYYGVREIVIEDARQVIGE